MLSEDLAILHRRGLISCENTEDAAHELRALAKSGAYEKRLWGAAGPVSPEQIGEHAARVASAFLCLCGPKAAGPGRAGMQ